jgi:hypothetical protein
MASTRAWRVLSFLAFASLLTGASPDPSPGADVLERYLAAAQEQQTQMRGLSMQVDIDASMPKLKKTGKLQALRNISKLGQITYNALSFVGDKTIRNDVIARYLTAETRATTSDEMNISITPANYKFKYKGVAERDGRSMHVFQLSPRKKKVGLFKGELWVDAATYMPLRESGRMVKNPSLFLKRVDFVRDYDIRDGIAFPRHMESTIETRLVGLATLNINYGSFSRPEITHAAAGQPTESQ